MSPWSCPRFFQKLHTDTLLESFPLQACSLSSPFALTTAPCTLSASCCIWFAECLVCRLNASLSLSSCSAATLFSSWVYRGIGLYISGSFRLVLPKVSPYLHHCVCLCATSWRSPLRNGRPCRSRVREHHASEARVCSKCRRSLDTSFWTYLTSSGARRANLPPAEAAVVPPLTRPVSPGHRV